MSQTHFLLKIDWKLIEDTFVLTKRYKLNKNVKQDDHQDGSLLQKIQGNLP